MNIAVTYLIEDDKVLLLYKEVRGYHVAPGGKIEENETIITAAKREFLEETGLEIEPNLASISTITTKDKADITQSIYTMFTFFATSHQGTLLKETREGKNAWHFFSEISHLPMFAGDKILLERCLAKMNDNIEQVTIDYAYFCYDTQYKKLLSYDITI